MQLPFKSPLVVLQTKGTTKPFSNRMTLSQYVFIYSISYCQYTSARPRDLHEDAIGLLILTSKNVISRQLKIPLAETSDRDLSSVIFPGASLKCFDTFASPGSILNAISCITLAWVSLILLCRRCMYPPRWQFSEWSTEFYHIHSAYCSSIYGLVVQWYVFRPSMLELRGSIPVSANPREVQPSSVDSAE